MKVSKKGNLSFIVRSMSNPDKTYRLVWVRSEGPAHWFCGCPAYIYQKSPRKPCKHMREMESLVGPAMLASPKGGK
jgi:hypothetical protein